jgi:hypothetical protein
MLFHRTAASSQSRCLIPICSVCAGLRLRAMSVGSPHVASAHRLLVMHVSLCNASRCSLSSQCEQVAELSWAAARYRKTVAPLCLIGSSWTSSENCAHASVVLQLPSPEASCVFGAMPRLRM